MTLSTFKNPLLASGADPWAICVDGVYYYTQTTFSNITLWKTSNLAELDSAERRTVWTPERRRPWSKNLWAPELHRIDGTWFIYFAADDGHNRNHRMWVLECDGDDPMNGNWTMLRQLETPDNCWAIDGTVLRHAGKSYLLWSGWEGAENGCQNIYIASMTSPWSVSGNRVRISTPEHEWEKHGEIHRPGPDDPPVVLVNEGPAALVRNGRVFVTYSASGSWTDHYKLGLLWADASNDLLNAASWRKRTEPVFVSEGVSGTFAAGHNSFFTSPDGTEDWILYHANAKPNQGWKKRAPRAQRFSWTSDGFPCFGAPAALREDHCAPSRQMEEPRMEETRIEDPVLAGEFGNVIWIPPVTPEIGASE